RLVQHLGLDRIADDTFIFAFHAPGAVEQEHHVLVGRLDPVVVVRALDGVAAGQKHDDAGGDQYAEGMFHFQSHSFDGIRDGLQRLWSAIAGTRARSNGRNYTATPHRGPDRYPLVYGGCPGSARSRPGLTRDGATVRWSS